MVLQHSAGARLNFRRHLCLSYIMKKILASMTVLATVTAHAEWVKIDSPLHDPVLYMDYAAAEKSGSATVKLWHIADYSSAQSHEGKAYRSIKANYEYDCGQGRFREIILILHKEAMGNGQTVYWTHGLWSLTHDPSTWLQPQAGSVEAALVAAACAK